MNLLENNLSIALSNSISDEAGAVATDLLEVGLDAILDDGMLKDVPILSTAVSLYKIGHSIKERHQIKKLAAFVLALNKGIDDEEKRAYYKNAVKENEELRNKELGYILILIDRYIHSDKAEMLAKLYLAYLDKIIDWEEYARFAEAIERFLPGDYYVLSCEIGGRYFTNSNDLDAFQRLCGLGLMCEDKSATSFKQEWYDDSSWTLQAEEYWYKRTAFGTKLCKILEAGDYS